MVAGTRDRERQMDSALQDGRRGGAGRKGTRASLFSAFRLARMHLARGWRMLLAVGLGILVAVVLLSSVPLYSLLIGNVQLQAVLNGDEPIARDVELQVPGTPLTADLAQRADAIVRPIAARNLTAYTAPAITRYYSAGQMAITNLNGQPVDVAGAGLRIAFLAYDYTQALPHMRIIAGDVPQPPSSGTNVPLGALITSQMAGDLGLHVGDFLTAAQSIASTQQLAPRVVGIWEPKAASDPYWNGRDFQAVTTETGTTYPVLLDQQAFLQAFAAFPLIETREHWVYYTLPARVTTANMGHLSQNLGALRTQLVNGLAVAGIGDPLVLTALPLDITQEQQRLALLAQPLYVVVVQILGLALLFSVLFKDILRPLVLSLIITVITVIPGFIPNWSDWSLPGYWSSQAAYLGQEFPTKALIICLIAAIVPVVIAIPLFQKQAY